MNLMEELKIELEKELRYVADRIISEKDLRRKVFFYSAAYGMTRRILNLQFSRQLACMDMVLQVSYQTINARVDKMVKGQDSTVPLLENFFVLLSSAVNGLADCVKSGTEPYKYLEEIVTLTYSTTGNGYYQLTKGTFKI